MLGAKVIAITAAESDTRVIDFVIPVNPVKINWVRVLTPEGKPLK